MLVSTYLFVCLLTFTTSVAFAAQNQKTKAKPKELSANDNGDYKKVGVAAALAASGATFLFDQQRKKVALLEQRQVHLQELEEQTKELHLLRARPMAQEIKTLQSDIRVLQHEKKAVQQQLVTLQARNAQLAKNARHWETQSQTAERIANAKWSDYVRRSEANNDANRRFQETMIRLLEETEEAERAAITNGP